MGTIAIILCAVLALLVLGWMLTHLGWAIKTNPEGTGWRGRVRPRNRPRNRPR